MPIIIDPVVGGFTGAPSKLMTLPATLQLARSETFPYTIDFTNYTVAGDAPAFEAISLFLSTTGTQVPNNLWTTGQVITGSVLVVEIFGTNLGLEQHYQLQTTLIIKAPFKVLTFITDLEVVA